MNNFPFSALRGKFASFTDITDNEVSRHGLWKANKWPSPCCRLPLPDLPVASHAALFGSRRHAGEVNRRGCKLKILISNMTG